MVGCCIPLQLHALCSKGPPLQQNSTEEHFLPRKLLTGFAVTHRSMGRAQRGLWRHLQIVGFDESKLKKQFSVVFDSPTTTILVCKFFFSGNASSSSCFGCGFNTRCLSGTRLMAVGYCHRLSPSINRITVAQTQISSIKRLKR